MNNNTAAALVSSALTFAGEALPPSVVANVARDLAEYGGKGTCTEVLTWAAGAEVAMAEYGGHALHIRAVVIVRNWIRSGDVADRARTLCENAGTGYRAE